MSRDNFSLRRTSAMVIKESRQVARDPSTFLIAFVLPMLLLFMFGYAINLDNSRARIGVALLDDSPPALSLAGAYANSTNFDVRLERSTQPLEQAIVAGSIRGFVVIPQDFGRGLARGAPPPIQIVTDGSQPNQAALTGAYAEAQRQNWMLGEAEVNGALAAPPIGQDMRVWFNSRLESRWFLVPGAIAIVMSIIGTLLTSLVIAREWERGTMEAMMATPMRMTEFLASKVVPYMVLALCSMAVCTLVAIWIFGLPMHGSVGALFALSFAFLLPALGQGLFISAATRNQFAASQIALLTGFLPTFLLSGFLYEISSMPQVIQWVTTIIPARYFIPALQTIFLAGDSWSVILPNIGMLLLFGAAFFLLCFRRTRRSIG